ncbi:histidinol-phosphate transaminase [cyanobacterium endosymbiont of Epithemia clementina EcSB]|uniref:histidinol-phosphate transaminase n=1 Tax=cyanobacterium endosymbiont of Epithemia clementina EcSB TaxID=3034674 RepID=UPI0024810A5C|nr:histidinol-phosphate transaminase [cyanobacterium endosymbiont of Epithemia clementina EcSB]WGT67945.1 histidinol-phosphate transaminase [cyanobacterium endosymbiont of Epithemia clementina EcSB]
MLPIRECVEQTSGYIPGEQPRTNDFIKLNTNENPYPPPLEIFEGLQQELTKVRLYPDPVSTQLRKAAAKVFGVSSVNILAGNGSDDILNIAVRTFVNPGETVTFLDLTYSLYETIARVHGASVIKIPTDNRFAINQPIICPKAKLIFIASPNPPVGKHLNRDYLEETCERATGIVLIDEAYADFSDENHLDFLNKYDNVIISRTMSKSYSIAGMRVGFGIASIPIIEQMNKVKDSYNLDRIAQLLGTNAFNFQEYFKVIWQKVRQTRSHLIESLKALDFLVFDSDSNFVFASSQWIPASELYKKLKERKILVRYFENPRIKDYVRISVGTDQEIARLLEVINEIKSGQEFT